MTTPLLLDYSDFISTESETHVFGKLKTTTERVIVAPDFPHEFDFCARNRSRQEAVSKCGD